MTRLLIDIPQKMIWLLILSGFIISGSCKKEPVPNRPDPVVIIGIDGMAWEMIRPLLEKRKYPVIHWFAPFDLGSSPSWQYLPKNERNSSLEVKPEAGILVIDRQDRPEIWGITHDCQRKSFSVNRFRIELEARSIGSKAQATIHVRYYYPKDIRISKSETYNTVWKTFKLGKEWSRLSIEIQAPNPSSAFHITILPYHVKTATDPLTPPAENHLYQRIMIKGIKLTPGAVVGPPKNDKELEALDDENSLLPNITYLMKNGASGLFETFNPAISPVIWTTIATGQGPDKHGISNFAIQAPGGAEGNVLASSSMRKCPAIWNIITDYGNESVGVVSWWVTWPAETIRGFIVSDYADDAALHALQMMRDKKYMAENRTAGDVYQEYSTYPPELFDQIHTLFIDHGDITREQMEKFIPGLEDRTWQAFEYIDQMSPDDRLNFIKFSYCNDLSTARAGLSVLKEKRPRLWMIYFNGVDVMSHHFWHYTDPELYPGVEPFTAKKLGGVIEDYYRFMDDVVGQIVEAAGPDASIFIVSDHGFYPHGFMMGRLEHEETTGGHWARSPGVFIASGPGIRRGHITTSADVFDITPTVLYLMDYPVADDLEGDIILDILDEDWLDSHPVKKVPAYSYLSNRLPPNVPFTSELNKYIKKRLKALGYLQ